MRAYGIFTLNCWSCWELLSLFWERMAGFLRLWSFPTGLGLDNLKWNCWGNDLGDVTFFGGRLDKHKYGRGKGWQKFWGTNGVIHLETGYHYHHGPSVPEDPLNNAIGCNSVVSHQRAKKSRRLNTNSHILELGRNYFQRRKFSSTLVCKRLQLQSEIPCRKPNYLGWACLKSPSDRVNVTVGKLRSCGMTLMALDKKKEEP